MFAIEGIQRLRVESVITYQDAIILCIDKRNEGKKMKIYTKIAASALAVTMVLTASSCGKTTEKTEDTTASTTATEETSASETTEETTTETTTVTADDTDISEETEAVPEFEGELFDLNEYPFDINKDNYIAALEAVGSDVSYEVDDFLEIINGIKSGDEDALDKYHDGIAVICSGDAVSELLDKFGDPVSSENKAFNEHLTGVCLFTAADAYTSDYQVVVMYYEFDDTDMVSDWFDSAASSYISSAANEFPGTDMYETSFSTYKNGNAKALITKLILTGKATEEYGEPSHSGAFVGYYVNGTRSIYISVVDMSEDATGIGMMQEFCNEMGLINPVDN